MNIYLFQHIAGIGVLLLHIIIVMLLAYLIYKKKTKKEISFFENIFVKNGILLVFLGSLFSLITSLIFSDIYHVEPCKLCWLQRIAMYPQVLIMFIALKKKDLSAWIYSFWLSFIGFMIAIYQVLEQFKVQALPQTDCVLGPDAACAKIHMLEFGYITFPLASATIFFFIILLFSMRKK